MALPTVAYYTTRMGFLIQAGTDKADYESIVNALLKTDGASGLVLCTEATKPTTNNFPGKYIKCTDSLKHYYLDGTGTFTTGVYTGGSWIEDSYFTLVSVASGNGNMIYGANTTTAFSPATNNTTTHSGKCPFNFATVNTNQLVLFDVDLAVDVTVSGTGSSTLLSSSIAGFQLPAVYITTDATDTLLGYLNPIQLGIVGTPSSSNLNSSGSLKFKAAVSIPTAGSHSASLKVIDSNIGFGGQIITFSVLRTGIVATASVA